MLTRKVYIHFGFFKANITNIILQILREHRKHYIATVCVCASSRPIWYNEKWLKVCSGHWTGMLSGCVRSLWPVLVGLVLYERLTPETPATHLVLGSSLPEPPHTPQNPLQFIIFNLTNTACDTVQLYLEAQWKALWKNITDMHIILSVCTIRLRLHFFLFIEQQYFL